MGARWTPDEIAALRTMRGNVRNEAIYQEALQGLHATVQDLWLALPSSSEAAGLLCRMDNRCRSARRYLGEAV